MTKWVYRFGRGGAEGNGEMRNLLGGKGAGLAEMSNLGLPVPPGFTKIAAFRPATSYSGVHDDASVDSARRSCCRGRLRQ